MLIGKLSKESGVSRDTVRYYEKIGLIQPDNYARHANRYKDYSVDCLNRLKTILELKTMGFTLAEIAQLLDSSGQSNHPCSHLPEQLRIKMVNLDNKIALLQQHRKSLQAIKDACNETCKLENGLPACLGCA